MMNPDSRALWNPVEICDVLQFQRKAASDQDLDRFCKEGWAGDYLIGMSNPLDDVQRDSEDLDSDSAARSRFISLEEERQKFQEEKECDDVLKLVSGHEMDLNTETKLKEQLMRYFVNLLTGFVQPDEYDFNIEASSDDDNSQNPPSDKECDDVDFFGLQSLKTSSGDRRVRHFFENRCRDLFDDGANYMAQVNEFYPNIVQDDDIDPEELRGMLINTLENYLTEVGYRKNEEDDQQPTSDAAECVKDSEVSVDETTLEADEPVPKKPWELKQETRNLVACVRADASVEYGCIESMGSKNNFTSGSDATTHADVLPALPKQSSPSSAPVPGANRTYSALVSDTLPKAFIVEKPTSHKSSDMEKPSSDMEELPTANIPESLQILRSGKLLLVENSFHTPGARKGGRRRKGEKKRSAWTENFVDWELDGPWMPVSIPKSNFGHVAGAKWAVIIGMEEKFDVVIDFPITTGIDPITGWVAGKLEENVQHVLNLINHSADNASRYMEWKENPIYLEIEGLRELGSKLKERGLVSRGNMLRMLIGRMQEGKRAGRKGKPSNADRNKRKDSDNADAGKKLGKNKGKGKKGGETNSSAGQSGSTPVSPELSQGYSTPDEEEMQRFDFQSKSNRKDDSDSEDSFLAKRLAGQKKEQEMKEAAKEKAKAVKAAAAKAAAKVAAEAKAARMRLLSRQKSTDSLSDLSVSDSEEIIQPKAAVKVRAVKAGGVKAKAGAKAKAPAKAKSAVAKKRAPAAKKK